VLRRFIAVVVVVACAAGVVAYQATRPARAPAGPRVFVPSPGFFLDFSPSFRTSIADAYYLNMVQYYGEHVNGDGRLDSLPQMVDLVTMLSPHFTRPYLFGAFGLMDAGRPDVSYKILRRGFAANPGNWRFPSYLGFFAYAFASNKDKNRIAADWYSKAAAIPGSPAYLKRLAAVLLGKGGETEKAILLWGQIYAEGDKFSRKKAVAGLDRILPDDKTARMKAVAPLVGTMPKDELDQLIADLFKGYE
jgi:hypothetical protein